MIWRFGWLSNRIQLLANESSECQMLNKEEWAKLKRSFIFGHSLGAIAQATGVSRGTLSAHSARHKWSRDRVAGTEILRKQNEW
jgi:hypothetical protein